MTSTTRTLRDSIAALIRGNPSVITLYRSTLFNDGMGGQTMSPPAMVSPPLVMRVAEVAPAENMKLTEAGPVPAHIVALTSPYDSDVRTDDLFVWGGKTFKVLFMREMKCEAEVYGLHGRAEEVAGGIG